MQCRGATPDAPSSPGLQKSVPIALRSRDAALHGGVRSRGCPVRSRRSRHESGDLHAVDAEVRGRPARVLVPRTLVYVRAAQRQDRHDAVGRVRRSLLCAFGFSETFIANTQNFITHLCRVMPPPNHCVVKFNELHFV